MGRQKQNKPRRERPSALFAPNAARAADQGQGQGQRRMSDIAAMLDLPTAISNGQAGVALEVAAVGFAGDGADTDGRPAYVRLTDGSVKLLPEGLRPWARSVIAAEAELRTAGEASAFPRRIEFGVADGAEYAEPR